MALPRSFAGGSFLLELDGVECGFLRSVEGGGITADVVSEHGQDFFDHKHLGAVRYEEVTLRLDLSHERAVWDWLAETLQGKARRRNVSIVALSADRKALSEREFFGALVTEVTVPAADAAARDPAFLTVKIAPEHMRVKKGTGATVKTPVAKHKAFVPSNFKLEIDGLDCTRVSKVQGLTVRQTLAADAVGEARVATRGLPRLEFSNLRVSLAEASAQTWTAWFDDFVVKGNNDDAHERRGKLSFLTPDRTTTLAEVRFFNLGIFRLAPEPRQAGTEQIARLQAALYCERMELKVG